MEVHYLYDDFYVYDRIKRFRFPLSKYANKIYDSQ